jgi:hypothetical protein
MYMSSPLPDEIFEMSLELIGQIFALAAQDERRVLLAIGPEELLKEGLCSVLENI